MINKLMKRIGFNLIHLLDLFFQIVKNFLGQKNMLEKDPELRKPVRKRSELKEISGKELSKHKLDVWISQDLLDYLEKEKDSKKIPNLEDGKFIMTRSIKREQAVF